MSQPNDPAIIDSSIVSISASSDKLAVSSSSASYSTATEHSTRDPNATNGGTHFLGGLEPGSALSKLLDSAAANAAKESTPEPDSAKSTSHLASPRRSSMKDFKPVTSQKSNVYSIEELLGLRSAPEIANFDTSVLPDQAFWVIKPQKVHKNREQNGSGNKRNSRRNQNQNQNQNQQNDLNGRWERKPTGFAKSSELDTMSQEKISQLLGENPEEGVPEWDIPGGSGDLNMDMGNTVEDFERWKQRMREGERKQYGEIETAPVDTEAPRGNEVDNFFSFVTPNTRTSTVPEPATSGSESSKTSRFSSFFGGPGIEESPKRSGPPPGLERSVPVARPQESAGSRFFGMAHGSPAQQNVAAKQERVGIPSGQQQSPMMQQMPPSMAQPAGPSPGGPPGLPSMALGGGNTQDSFFRSLMKKRDSAQGEDLPKMGGEQKQAEAQQSPAAGRSAPQGLQGTQGQQPQGPQGGRQNIPPGMPQFMGNPQMGGVPPAGYPRGPQQMYQFQGPPQGMFPPGMNIPPGMLPQGFPGMQGRPQQGRDGQPDQGMYRGQLPPPGFYGFPPGMGQGMPQHQQRQQPQQQPQQQQQQQQRKQ